MAADFPTPARLAGFIKETELPLRRAGRWLDVAAEVLRCGAIVGSVIEHYPQLDRTMLTAREIIHRHERQGRPIASGMTIFADELRASKGRFTRYWHAPTGGLWGTLVLVNTLLPPARQLLPLAAGMAGCEAIRRFGADGVIRWINDILIGGRKAAGFLCETFTGEHSGEEYCLIGFGINVNNASFPDALQSSATSLRLNLGRSVDLNRFACTFLAALAWNIGLLHFCDIRTPEEELPGYGLHLLLQDWLSLSDSIGRQVVYGFDVETQPQFRAMTTGLSGEGGLRLRLDDGSEVVEFSGEIRYLDGTV